MRRYLALVVCLSVLCFVAGAAQAGMIVLGTSGWQASWDVSLDPYVSVTVDSETSSAVYIEKAAQFTQAPGPGGFQAISIQFTQISYPAVTQIIINDESLTNQTGVDWTDFHFEVLDGPNAAFNSALTDASAGGTGFTTSPLDNQTWGAGDTSFTVDGFGLGAGGTDAVVAAGTDWYPGNGALDGELFIDVVPSENAPYTVFTLKERPTPEPATLGLLLIGGLAILRRRSR